MNCRLILVRHAQSAPSPDLPEADWPLSETGERQAEDLVAVLRGHGVNALASSPYARAIATLDPFARGANLDIAVDADLRERDLGGWLPDLAAVEEAVRRMHADLDFSLEGGETGTACLQRFDAALVRVAAANEGACVAIGSHGGVLGHLLARIHDDLPDAFWRRIRNPHLFFLDWDGALRWRGEQTLDGSQGVRGMAD